MLFEISSYIGASPLCFDMSPQQVIAVLGEPKIRLQHGLEYRYGEMYQLSVGFNDSLEFIDEIGIALPATVSYRGIDLFEDRESYRKLIEDDGAAKEFVGFIILLNLGVALCGFHNDDDPAVKVFRKGLYDEYIPQMKPFKQSIARK